MNRLVRLALFVGLSVPLLLACTEVFYLSLSDNRLQFHDEEITRQLGEVQRRNVPCLVKIKSPDEFTGRVGKHVYYYPLKQILQNMLENGTYCVFSQPGSEVLNAYSLEVEVFNSELVGGRDKASYHLYLLVTLRSEGGKAVKTFSVQKKRLGALQPTQTVPDVIYETAGEAVVDVVRNLTNDPQVQLALGQWEKDPSAVRPEPSGDQLPYVVPEQIYKEDRPKIALVIGIDAYKKWPRLKNAVADARNIGHVLNKDYGFSRVIEIFDSSATRSNILAKVQELVDSLRGGEDVLIYFSGHGYYDRTLSRGYWIPADAESEADFLPNSEIHDYVKAMNKKKALHVFVIADSCFAGTIVDVRAVVPVERDDAATTTIPRYVLRLRATPSRQVLTSGGNEPVMDGGAEGHSVFAYYLLKTLRSPNYRAFTATELATSVQRLVGDNSDQTPRYGVMPLAGHEGGDFVFVREK